MSLQLSDQHAPALHLVRHGQSTWNVVGLVQGQIHHPELTDLGRLQAAAAARLLAGSGATRLLTSDLCRAVQTAEIIGVATDLAPIKSSLLREQGLGILEGLSSEQAGIAWELAAQQALDDYGEPVPATALRPPGGESMEDVRGRVAGILASPWVTDCSGDVVIVSHGDTIRIMLAHLLGDDFENLSWRPVGNGDVHSVYRTSGGGIAYVVTLAGPTVEPPQ